MFGLLYIVGGQENVISAMHCILKPEGGLSFKKSRGSEARLIEEMKKEEHMEGIIQHYMNPLHIYCRLRELGLSKQRTMAICKWLEDNFLEAILY